MKTKLLFLLVALGLLSALTLTAAPLGTAFTYQGKLADGGQPANGLYDFQFALHDAATGGNSIANAALTDVPVTNGSFTVPLDFGANAFPGAARWLGITVSATTNGTPVALTPRQPITAAPYALFAAKAASAVHADSVNLGGSGTNVTAAHSDHDHFGQTWAGVSAGSGFNLHNTSTDGRALTGKQGMGSGYSSQFGVTSGIWGDSHDGWGLFGSSFDGAGVHGLANDTEYNVHSTYGGYFRNNGYGYGVFASSARGQAAHFEVAAANSQPALVASSAGTSHAALFVINNSANANDAVSATTSGSGDGVSGFNSGTGQAGRFQITSAGNASDAVFVQTIGSGDAIHALATGAGNGVDGRSSGSGSAIYAKSTGAGAALELAGGGIKVSGPSAPVFVHVATLANIVAQLQTVIDHPLCNNKPDAILIVTPRMSYFSDLDFDAPFAVSYDVDRLRWSIRLMTFNVSEWEIEAGQKFNVLVVNP